MRKTTSGLAARERLEPPFQCVRYRITVFSRAAAGAARAVSSMGSQVPAHSVLPSFAYTLAELKFPR